ncbi:MAG: aminotransferase class V-fold PLP-dependent enzyme [Clostridia bacterium]|nr:aminotransferase class V-fold PLP-dependent enzyme [Clostridia bacterium]
MIYFDNAATTFPKPPTVRREIDRCLRDYCGNPGRSAHALSLAAAEAIYDCRAEAAALLGVPSPEQIIFTYNTTHALNMAIKGLLRRGDHVLISDMEHNAVYRPIWALAGFGEITYDVYPTFPEAPECDTTAILSGIEERLKPNTRMVIASHISNLCSAMLPITEIGAFCRERGLLFVVDAAQSAGIEAIDCTAMQIDALCAPGHKGLYGPQGTGLLALREGLKMSTLLEGGNGINSLDGAMPDFSPERYEAGTLATPALAGLCAGIRFVRARGIDSIRAAERRLYRRLRDQLTELPGVTLYAPAREGSTLLFNLDGIPSAEAAARLDEAGICLRAGFHCAPLGHATLGTGEDGALRVGFSVFNCAEEVDVLVRVVAHILHKMRK